MKKQSGFTLIELMVVMAIIAILATAGLTAYTGYIKKARDSTRIADLAAINSIVLGSMSSTGLVPDSASIVSVIQGANAGNSISDPISGTYNCYNAESTTTSTPGTALCNYVYYDCDSLTGYRINAWFESPANTDMYSDNASGAGGSATEYDIGNCGSTISSMTL